MMDGRRHSVDIPISRTLVALRRVRSLRDPSTNSMTKFSAVLENVNWETTSSNEVSVRFMNDIAEVGSSPIGFPGFRSLALEQHKEDDQVASEINGAMDDQKDILENQTLIERYERQMELACTSPLEDVDSTGEPNGRSTQGETREQLALREKPRYKCNIQQSSLGGDILSCVGSPNLSISDAFSSRSASLYLDEDANFGIQGEPGCGITCCWTRTPRLRESYPYSSGGESYPLLSRDAVGTSPHGQSSWKHGTSDTPRCLSQKFRPRSFNDVVGQNVVVRSLLGAISRCRVASFYLFHGPRGTGKTSASRIFAAAVNCISLEDHKPCGLCRECLLFFSGKSRDVKEVDPVRVNRTDRFRSLMKSAEGQPVSSRFKVFIVDECHLLHGETWSMFLNNLENLSQHVVFLMITPDLDKLPTSAVARAQRYHFQMLKDSDITVRLRDICIQERLDFDEVALDFIASKSNGSLRDAEMMLDQLSLLGKRITVSLVYELIGVVSDDELLDLLDLALSSDTSNTVIKARELMSSRIDPTQLVSQLANLIMDILATKCQEDCSEARKRFSKSHASEADMQRLRNALNILSETEKQLRMSKNQSTWLTVALLQLSSLEASSLDANDSKSSSERESLNLKHLVPCSCQEGKLHKLRIERDWEATLESIWDRVIKLCQSSSLKNFLRKQGKLSALSVNQELAVAELEFHHRDSVYKAEKSWKLIASLLQTILGCNVEIRINLVLYAPISRCARLRKLSFSLFSCSRRIRDKAKSPARYGSDTDFSDLTSERPMIGDKVVLPRSSSCHSQLPDNKVELASALRNSDGNVLTMGVTSSQRSLLDNATNPLGCRTESAVKDWESNHESVLGQDAKDQSHCFPKRLGLQNKLISSGSSQIPTIADRGSSGTYTCADGSYVFGGNCDAYNSKIEDGLREESVTLCWRTPASPLGKDWQLRDERQRSPLVGWVLPCGTAK
ncbi:Protein STICHEL-like 2 [Linum perenne]